jgi:predicted nucleotidyltransferase
VVGALAVSARSEPRFTRDLDLAVVVSGDPDAEGLIHELQRRGYQLAAIVEQQATGRLATARLIPQEEGAAGIVVDLLFASSGIELEIVSSAETLPLFRDLPVPVATVGHLIALKVLARDDTLRPQDRADLVALVRAADPGDLARAREAVSLIQQRGFHRGRDLSADLRQILGESVHPAG